MANNTLLAEIVSGFTPQSWQINCITQLNSTGFDWSSGGIVDGNGNPVYSLTNSTWGIKNSVCNQYCNSGAIPFAEDFQFQSFSASMTNYFLPWLALTAQLPFETGDPWNNVMSFCLAVGSPTMIRRTFRRLRYKAHAVRIKDKYGDYEGRIRASQYLLQEAQQVPLRASQERGWLSSLIVIPRNAEWWEHLEDRLKSTRRGITASLVARWLLAFIAFLFTVISSFQADLGDPTTALQIASGSLWIWLMPIILGWVTVGTQNNHHSIEDALNAEFAYRALEPPIPPKSDFFAREDQKGLVVKSGLTPQPHRVQTVAGGFEIPNEEQLTIPSWAGASVGGDEQVKGPIYNYARLFTWWKLASSIDRALFQTLQNLHDGKSCRAQGTTRPIWDDQHPQSNLEGDSLDTARYCGLDSRPILAYQEWSELPAEIYRRIFAAACAGIFLQWGTTGASLLIAYLTPMDGLGCRCASYLLYGGLGTLVWLFLLVSMLLSHEVMLRYQRLHTNDASIDFRIRKDPNNPHQYSRTLSHSALCGAAIVFRYLGKSLALINTLWLIVSSLMEFVGGFENCWCKGDMLSYGLNGYVVVFKDASDLAATVDLPWALGLAMALVVCVASYVFFAVGSIKTKDD